MITKEQEEFIQAHFYADIASLRLLYSRTRDDIDFLIDQIKGRKKAKQKFPFLLDNTACIFPAYLSVEQASSEKTALYKSKYFQGKSVLDMTGGMGIDAIFAAPLVMSYVLIEQSESLAKINAHNFQALSINNIEVINADSVSYLQNNPTAYFDTIFLDPARRENQERGKRNKVFLLEECQPNILDLQQLLFTHTDKIVLKLSPMLDISALLNSLDQVKRIVVIGVKNEVKELLIVLEKSDEKLIVEAVNIRENGLDVYENERKDDGKNREYDLRRTYLYEPYKSLIKSELQDIYAYSRVTKKLHPNTQIYTSHDLVKDFMGRTFRVLRDLPTSIKQFRKVWNKSHANIISRNHPMKANEIEKRYGLKPGGNSYILAFTDMKGKQLVEAELL